MNFEFDLALDPEVRAMCSGVYEVWTLRALRAWLEPDDTFVDVGADIGFISAYAASVVDGIDGGKERAVHAVGQMAQGVQVVSTWI